MNRKRFTKLLFAIFRQITLNIFNTRLKTIIQERMNENRKKPTK